MDTRSWLRRSRERRLGVAAGALALSLAATAATASRIVSTAPAPTPVQSAGAAAQADRIARLAAVRSWGYQLAGLKPQDAARAPYDLLVIDATTGLGDQRHITPGEVAALQRKPDGSRRIVAAYLSVGEAEDYRPDYFTAEYMEEDAPDWLMHENPSWKGNRIIRFCSEGWQQTILGDERGRNVYNSIEPSPLHRLVELGLDGVYLDRVDVYREVGKECPNAEARMVDFIVRLAAHARRKNPNFMVILQNAEELVRHPRMLAAIDAISKEDLFYGADHSQSANPAGMVQSVLRNLEIVKRSGRAVLVVDYVKDAARKADVRRRTEAHGFVPYVGPRALDALWLPGRDF